ncbi:MAG: glucosaminidase domain-containing protein [Pseudomonadales bacterium]|nr:glucosaminidase domain-containing protein [Pseudomonadales bacterium]
MPNRLALSVIPLIIAMVALLLWVANRGEPVPEPATPDFGAMSDVNTKKRTFFAYLLPMVQQSNKDIGQERAAFLKISKQLEHKRSLTAKQTESIRLLTKKYRVTTGEPLSENAITSENVMTLLDRRIDSIPASLALAQAANESGWGTARFAVKGNNYFGLWCWSSDCGLVPNERKKGASHEVSTFKAPVDSVKNYMLTLNSHPAYTKLRDLRAAARNNHTPVAGAVLAGGLLYYSERGEAYIEELRAMIRINNLSQFDQTDLDPSP